MTYNIQNFSNNSKYNHVYLGEEKETNKTQLIWSLLLNFYLNMFWTSLCPSSGEPSHSAHSSRPNSTQPQPAQPVQNTIRSYTQSCSPEDGHNDAWNMLREKFSDKNQISCILLVSSSSPYVHYAWSQEPKTCLPACITCTGRLIG